MRVERERKKAWDRGKGAESKLMEEQRRVTITLDELKAAREKISKGEGQLDDVRKECQHPFVVPALFDAFLMMGECRNEMMEEEP